MSHSKKPPEEIIEDESNFKRKRALLVSVYKNTNQKNLCLEHLQELVLLTETYGVDVADKIPCFIRKYDASTLVTEGKLEELISKAHELKVDLVIFDDEIAPSQQRNLENLFKLPVVDRTGIILEVFGQRAQTKEAKLQIELAKVRYQAPRLKRLWSHLSRQAGTGGKGGGAYLKGEGEKQIEIDRRLLKKQIDTLQKEIAEVKAYRDTQRGLRLRSEIPVFAIVGYTNAGKSTLLNALTQANVFVEDKLFATLDTTTRKFLLPNNQEILLIDTVGFIRKLPHLLVAAFKSTLEEALEADILLHLVDASNPAAEEQAATTYEVLQGLNAEQKTIITVLNKVDQCEDNQMLTRMRILYPKSIAISALNKTGLEDLYEQMIQELSRKRAIVRLRIPQSEYHNVSEVMRFGNILNQDYEENDVLLKVDIPQALAGKLRRYIQEE
jgi:GTP-binding protein HflX